MPSPTGGALTQLWIGDSTVAPRLIDFLSETIKRRVAHIDGNALKGTFSRNVARIREGLRVVNGQLSWEPQAADLNYILPYILNGTPSSDTYPVGSNTTAFNVYKNFAGANGGNRINTFAGVKVNQATFSGSAGQLMRLSLDVVGLTMTATSTGAPTITVDTTTTMFAFHDASVTVGGTVYKLFDISVTINNAMRPRWINSRDADVIYQTDRIITISHSMPEDQAVIASFEDVNVAATITFTNANQSFAMIMPAIRYDPESIAIAGRDETNMPLTGTAYKSGSATTTTTQELYCTLDYNPS